MKMPAQTHIQLMLITVSSSVYTNRAVEYKDFLT
jgi:hypothetical protein